MAAVSSPGTKGNDTIVQATGSETIYGDPFDLVPLASGHGGNDILTATGGSNFLFGDADVIEGTGRGGNDSLSSTGGGDRLYGDAFSMFDGARGGNDILIGVEGTYELYGDASGIRGTGRGGNDVLSVTGGGGSLLYGDAFTVIENARGGNDVLSATGDFNSLAGEAGVAQASFAYDSVTATFSFSSPLSVDGGLSGDARGGNDQLEAIGNNNKLIGDGAVMAGRTVGGNDLLEATGGSNILFGDGAFMDDDAKGGNDSLGAAGNGNALFGDAVHLNSLSSGSARGGNDTLIATSASGDFNFLFGDAFSMAQDARGGNDTLIGGIGNDLIVGDAVEMHDNAKGGNDKLWGDPQDAAAGGADLFLFAGAFAKDTVYDFRHADGDKIDLRAYDLFDDISDLVIQAQGGNAKIDIGASLGGPVNTDTITLMGVTANTLVNDDFIFAA